MICQLLALFDLIIQSAGAILAGGNGLCPGIPLCYGLRLDAAGLVHWTEEPT